MTARSRRDTSAGNKKETAKSHASYLSRKVIPCPFPGCDTKHSCKYNLKQHTREKHTKERPYLCKQPGCGADFTRAWLLKRHKEVKHPGTGTGQVHVFQEDVDMQEKDNENIYNDKDYAPYFQSVPHQNNGVKALRNVRSGGFDELDCTTWTRLTAVPPPSNPAIYVCMNCNFDNVHLTAGGLQAHYHVAHNASSDGANCTIDPRIL